MPAPNVLLIMSDKHDPHTMGCQGPPFTLPTSSAWPHAACALPTPTPPPPRPGLPAGTPGNGTPAHAALELMRAQTKVNFVHLPCRGAAPATVVAVARETSFALVGTPCCRTWQRAS